MWKDRDATLSTVSLESDMDTTQRKGRFTRNDPSSPTKSKPTKSAMIVLTQDESLHGRRKRVNDKKKTKQLQFDTVEIREYKRTVGDNPSCSSGPPLAIEWEYDPEPVIVPVEEFEEYRPPRRTQFELMLGREERYEILEEEWNIPQSEIANAIRQNIKAKNQRLRTLNNMGRVSDIEERVESVRRKLKKMSWQKRSSKEAEDLANASSIVQKQPQPTRSSSSRKSRGRRRVKEEDYPDPTTA